MKTLSIPVQPHVLKYLQVHLPAEYHLNAGDHFGLYLMNLLQVPLVDARKEAFVATKCISMFECQVRTYNILSAYRRNLTANAVFLFNSFVHKLIIAELHSFVDEKVSDGHRQKASIELFMEKYDFTDSDLGYDTLKKSYQRYADDEAAKLRGHIRLNWRRELAALEKKLLGLPLPGRLPQAVAA